MLYFLSHQTNIRLFDILSVLSIFVFRYTEHFNFVKSQEFEFNQLIVYFQEPEFTQFAVYFQVLDFNQFIVCFQFVYYFKSIERFQ